MNIFHEHLLSANDKLRGLVRERKPAVFAERPEFAIRHYLGVLNARSLHVMALLRRPQASQRSVKMRNIPRKPR